MDRWIVRRRTGGYTIQRLFDSKGQEFLYILTFYLPRFMDLSFREKLITVFHELWHISPQFDGDLRRHPGRCYAHTSSQKEYDAEMEVLQRGPTLLPSRPTRTTAFFTMDSLSWRSVMGGFTERRSAGRNC